MMPPMMPPMTARIRGIRLGARDRRALAWGALVALPALAYAFVVKPYVSALRAERAEVAVQRALLRRELDVLAAAPSMPAEIAGARSVLAAERARLFAGDAVAATSQLSVYVTDAVRESGMALQQVDAREPTVLPSGLRELSIELRGEGDLEGLLGMLESLEGGDRLIRVTRLVVERGAAPSFATAGRAAPATEALAVVATIHGYAGPEADSAFAVAASATKR